MRVIALVLLNPNKQATNAFINRRKLVDTNLCELIFEWRRKVTCETNSPGLEFARVKDVKSAVTHKKQHQNTCFCKVTTTEMCNNSGPWRPLKGALPFSGEIKMSNAMKCNMKCNRKLEDNNHCFFSPFNVALSVHLSR